MNTEQQQMIKALNGIVDIQQHLVGLGQRQSIGERIFKADPMKNFHKGDMYAKFSVSALEMKAAIAATGAANDPLVASMTPAINAGIRRNLTIRDLLPSFPTETDAIELPVKTLATVSGSGSQNGQNASFSESAYTFDTSLIPVQTLGHHVPVSKQIFSDASSLSAFINMELLYGLALKIENQLLNSDGTNGELTGLLDNATAYAGTSPLMTNDLDIVRHAMLQVELAEYAPSAIILNASDWHDIETRKGGAGDDGYVAGSPRLMTGPTLWGLPVVSTNSIASGTFLVGDFNRAAAIFEREEAAIELSYQDGDNFRLGMVTARAMERLALVVSNPLALCKGSL